MSMLFVDGAMGLVLFALWIFCLIDVITTDEVLCRNLPKGVWVLIVLVLFDVGAIVWLVAGRTWPSQDRGPGLPYRGNTGGYPEHERAEEQRRRHREQGRADEPGAGS
jgi:hypothetical protein